MTARSARSQWPAWRWRWARHSRSPPARAERLIVSVSNHRVTVTPNYSGEELVLFGSVEKDATTPGDPHQLTISWSPSAARAPTW